jgi:endonuclease YncB( thermonuclease family)
VRILFPLTVAVALGSAPAAAQGAATGPCTPGTHAPWCTIWKGKAAFVDDGDTIDVDIPGDGRRKPARVRITGIQAMEQTVYTSFPRKRRGECHALEATARLEQLVKEARGRVRLAAVDPASTSGGRVRRAVSVKINGRWHDVGQILIAEGHALWLPNRTEDAWNVEYSTLSQWAASRGVGLWDPDYCGYGPNELSPFRLTVKWNAPGNDGDNPNGERVRIQNLDLFNPLPLGGWWLRDSALRRYTFPPQLLVPPGGVVYLRVGVGTDTDNTLYWGLPGPVFENIGKDGHGMGDGAYLFDSQGDLRASDIYPCRFACDQPTGPAPPPAVPPS